MKRILLIGLPYFTAKTKEHLFSIDKKNSYIVLNTYYRFIDKIRFLLLLPFSYSVYSINGVIDKSMAISLALFLKKKVVFHWVGSDVKTALAAYEKGKYKQSFLLKPLHLTNAPWLLEELKKIGINAILQPLFLGDDKKEITPFPIHFSVLTYIPQHKQEFYGIHRLKRIAEQLPDINFDVLATEKPITSMPANVTFHGWVESSAPYIQNSVVCLRIPKSDGLSFFVIEAYSQARYVIYNQKLIHAFYEVTDEAIINRIRLLKEQFDKGELQPNYAASKWVYEEFSKDKFSNLVKFLTQ